MTTQGPPTNLTAASLVRKLAEIPRPSKVVPFPGMDAMLRMQVPTILAHSQARILGEDTIRSELKRKLKREPTADDLSSHTSQAVIGDEVAMELMARCCVSVEPIGMTGPGNNVPQYEVLFGDASYLRNNLSADQIAILFTEFQCVQRELGPYYSMMGEFELDAWIDKLEEGLWALDPLSSLVWLDLAELALSSCRRVRELENQLKSLIESSTSQIQGYPQETLQTSSDSTKPSSQEDIIYSGEPRDEHYLGVAREYTQDEIIELAKKLPR